MTNPEIPTKKIRPRSKTGLLPRIACVTCGSRSSPLLSSPLFKRTIINIFYIYLSIFIKLISWVKKLRLYSMARGAIMATSSVSPRLGLLLLLGITISVYVQEGGAAKFEIQNQCGYTVWAAGTPGGGQQLQKGETWTVDVPAGTAGARFWGRTGCSFDGNGRGSCQTGDCGGLLSCQASGAVPATLAEYTLNQSPNMDFYDISLVDGFNIPLSFAPTNAQCTTVNCNSDINAICPAELKVTGGCNSACATFHTDQYCCTGANTNNCAPTNYSMIFKKQCPQAYSYAKDDSSSTFTCSSGSTDYKIVFCP